MNQIQPTIKQRKNECSLTCLCILNGYTQATYEMLSNKLRNEGFTFLGTGVERKVAIDRAIQMIRQLGKVVPAGYGYWQFVPGDDEAQLVGKGIVYISMRAPRKRKRNYHVVVFEGGKIIDTNQTTHASWKAYVAHLIAKGWKEARIEKIYPA